MHKHTPNNLKMGPAKTFSPLREFPVYAAFLNGEGNRESQRSSWTCLSILSDPAFNSYVPYAWGFTIYRVRFPGDSDERFESALRRFELWARWLVRAARHGNDNSGDPVILPDGQDPTDQLAERFYNQVFEFTPDENEPVIIEPEGKEDFYTVGVAFSEWVSSLNVLSDDDRNATSDDVHDEPDDKSLASDEMSVYSTETLPPSNPNARYDQCLIIDKHALESLEKLPETVPPLEHYDHFTDTGRALHAIYYRTWVWVLDRRSNERLAAGEDLGFSLWMRLRICWLQELWFHGPKRESVRLWRQLAEHDKEIGPMLAWWNPQGGLINMVRQQVREDPTLAKKEGDLASES